MLADADTLEQNGHNMTYGFEILKPEVSKPVDGGYTHLVCGNTIMGATVILSNRDGVGPLTGDGSTQQVTVPYCPSCEDKPRQYGEIHPDGRIVHPSFVPES